MGGSGIREVLPSNQEGEARREGGIASTIRGERRMGERGKEEQGGVGSKRKGGATRVGEKENRR